MKRAEEEAAASWDEYRQLLAERTEGKLILMTAEEAMQLIGEGVSMLTYRVCSPDDLAPMRHVIRMHMATFGLPAKRVFHYLVAVNEAVTNALLYGKDVSVQILHMGEEPFCRIAVLDGGEGIPLSEIPKAVLLRGYSKRNTLGVGFPVMLHYSDRLWLSTSTCGTVLLLDLYFEGNAASRVNIH